MFQLDFGTILYYCYENLIRTHRFSISALKYRWDLIQHADLSRMLIS
uniref:Uncharacterized protein n=1 Tax=Rhizophora mucronata TaxID=61149 RepID=A0A2P2NXW0_RHIMU